MYRKSLQKVTVVNDQEKKTLNNREDTFLLGCNQSRTRSLHPFERV